MQSHFSNQAELDQENNEYLLFRKIDANVDTYAIDFEKKLQKLPSSLKFIKKYLYYEFLPKIDKIIEELETIRESPNYDENLVSIRPISIKKTARISCLDLFDNHNIKHFKTQKMIYGTFSGMVVIMDMEADKQIIEKRVSPKNRIEIISTVTVKYYDTYLSRIAVSSRGDPNVQIFSYNHSYCFMSLDCIVNLLMLGVVDPVVNYPLSLGNIPSGIKLSRDSFYMAVTDYLGGVRMYKFNDIPQPMQGQSSLVPTNNVVASQASSRSTMRKESQSSKNPIVQENILLPVFISHIKRNEYENFTIININKEDTSRDPKAKTKDKDKDKDKLNPPASTRQNPPTKGVKQPLNDKKDKDNIIALDETNYNQTALYDDSTLQDITPSQKYDKHHPFVCFVQKKLIFEEKFNGGFSACLITVGVYVAFYNTTTLKFVSLYPYLTDNMRNIFKVVKTRGGGGLTPEESMSLTTTMAKKEREYISYIKSKMETVMTSVVNAVKDKESSLNKQAKEKNINIIPSETTMEQTKPEMNFSTLFPITVMQGQKQYNNMNNLIAVGMKDGSILVWDCELHTDKFFMQEDRAEVVSLAIDENYLSCGSLDGQVHIYELIRGNRIYKCYHNPYINLPVHLTLPFFPFMSAVSDTDNKICIYNAKERHKIAKLKFEDLDSKKQSYQIAYYNKHMSGFTEDYLIYVCDKDITTDKNKFSILDLINFQKKKEKTVVDSFKNVEFLNYFQAQQGSEKKIGNRYLVIFKTRDILFKCYPDLVYSYKKGLSLHKIMKKYDACDFPTFVKKLTLDVDSKPQLALADFTASKKKKSNLKVIAEKEKIDNRMSRSFDIKDTASPEIKKTSSKTFTDLKKTKQADEAADNVKQNLLANLTAAPKDLQRGGTLDSLVSTAIINAESEYFSSQKKDIFYFSFKSLRDRYQYKEQRANKIQLRNEKILKDIMQLPVISKK